MPLQFDLILWVSRNHWHFPPFPPPYASVSREGSGFAQGGEREPLYFQKPTSVCVSCFEVTAPLHCLHGVMSEYDKDVFPRELKVGWQRQGSVPSFQCADVKGVRVRVHVIQRSYCNTTCFTYKPHTCIIQTIFNRHQTLMLAMKRETLTENWNDLQLGQLRLKLLNVR